MKMSMGLRLGGCLPSASPVTMDWSQISNLLAAWEPYTPSTRFTTSTGSTQAGALNALGRLDSVSGSLGTTGDLLQASSGRRPLVAPDNKLLMLLGAQGLSTRGNVAFGSEIASIGFVVGGAPTVAANILETGVNPDASPERPGFRVTVEFSPSTHIDTRVFGSSNFNPREEDTSGTPPAGTIVIVMCYNNTANGDVRVFYDGVEQSLTVSDNSKTGTGNFVTQVVNFFCRDAAGTLSSGYSGMIAPLFLVGGEMSSGEISYASTTLKALTA